MPLLLTQVMHEYTALENFWKRYNKVMGSWEGAQTTFYMASATINMGL